MRDARGANVVNPLFVIYACFNPLWQLLPHLPLARPRPIDCSHGDPGDGSP